MIKVAKYPKSAIIDDKDPNCSMKVILNIIISISWVFITILVFVIAGVVALPFWPKIMPKMSIFWK